MCLQDAREMHQIEKENIYKIRAAIVEAFMGTLNGIKCPGDPNQV